MNLQMKRVDFENGTITSNILGASLPMLVAQILSLLYNIVDRIYIARIPHIGTAALGAVGLCFPVAGQGRGFSAAAMDKASVCSNAASAPARSDQ